ncbi:MAG: DUF2237 domain-containing protein [Pseudomonadota bacterium]
MNEKPVLNVLGSPLLPCSFAPLTGFFRDGCCKTDEHDHGRHLVCAQVTAEFLAFSVARGNDLVSPRAEYLFPGLKPGDFWCLCALRWSEALEAGIAPPVKLAATHAAVTQFVSKAALLRHGLDAPSEPLP